MQSGSAVRRALDLGQSFYRNVTRSVRRSVPAVRRGTPQSRHTDFQRARAGVGELNRLGLVAVEAARSLGGERNGARQADVSGTILEQCFPEIICDPDARFRESDGTCNNLKIPILGRVMLLMYLYCPTCPMFQTWKFRQKVPLEFQSR